MEVLGALEDMLYESVTFGGDHDDEEEVWNSCESKEGGNLREEIEAFKRKTKARTARRRGFAVSTKLSIET